jgi:hypothetical protein
MPLLKDTEREQLRQLVKACLLEISKLKIELKKCQKESSNSIETDDVRIKALKEELQEHVLKKDEEIEENLQNKEEEIIHLNQIIQEKDDEIKQLETIKKNFEAIISPPKKNLTSFQSQIYKLLPYEEDTSVNLFSQLKKIGFTELSNDNFEHALRNLERKGYFESNVRGKTTLWKKLDR